MEIQMTNTLINCDCFDYLASCKPFCCTFADPPDNIGLKYNGFKDKFTDEEYACLLRKIVYLATAKCDTLWLSINSRHSTLIGHILHQWKHKGWEVKHCVQTFTFSQDNRNDLGNGHRILYRIMREGTELYPDRIRVPSWRQLNGDKRADPRGKVPNDHFDFPRVVGNSKQRRKFAATQLNEGLYERCIKLTCPPGSTVVDLFAGSGTLGRVAERCEVNSLMLEYSRETCDNILKDQSNAVEVSYD